MQILVRVALPAAARERAAGSSSRTESNDNSTSSFHSLVAVDFSPSSSRSSASLASIIAERALHEAGHPHAHRALASGEWRAVFSETVGEIGTSSSSGSEMATRLLSVAPSALALSGGKGGFGSLLRASGRVAKVTDQGACRDLSGRRLKHVEQERAAAEWLAAAPARAEAEAARKRAAEEARRRAQERITQEAEASVDAKALKEAQERAARETAAAVAEAEAQQGRKEDVGAAAVAAANGKGKEAAAEEEEQKEKNHKKKKKSALDALAGLSGDDDDGEESDDSSSDSDGE